MINSKLNYSYLIEVSEAFITDCKIKKNVLRLD